MKINPADKKVKSRVKKAGDGAVVRSHRPLRGRNIFLHLLGWRGAEKFEENLKLLGASIEKCFSREVNVLITNQGVAKDYERLHSKVVSVSGASPTTPSPFNLASIKSVDSPQPESSGDAASRKPLTRGQSIALRATRNAGSGDVIENARRWKIKIIHIEQAQKYVQREIEKIPPCDQGQKNSKGSTSKHKVKRLQGNFIKFEACNRMFRPVMKSFTSFPSINTSTPFGTCPFDQPKKVHGSLPVELATERAEREEHNKDGEEDVDNAALRELEQCDELNPADVGSPPDEIKGRTRHGAKEKQDHHAKPDLKSRPSSRKLEKMAKPSKSHSKGIPPHLKLDKVKAELKHGYCETCEIKYSDIDKHIKTEQHKRFARQSTNYKSLDELIQQGPNMEQFLNDVLRYHELHKREAQNTDSGGETADGSCVVTSQRRLRPRHHVGQLSDPKSCTAKRSLLTDHQISSDIRSNSHLQSPRRKSLRRNLLVDVVESQNRLPRRRAKSPQELPTTKEPLAQSPDVKTKNSSSLASNHKESCDQLKSVSSRLHRRIFVQQAVEVRRSPRLLNVERRCYVKEEDSSYHCSLVGSVSSPLAEDRKKQLTSRSIDKEKQSPGKHCDFSDQYYSPEEKTRSSLLSTPPEHKVGNLDMSPWNRIPATAVVLLSPRVFVTPLKDTDVSRPTPEVTEDTPVSTTVSPSKEDRIVENKSILRKPGVKSPLKKVIFHQNDITNEGAEPMLEDKENGGMFIEGVTRLTSDPSPCTEHRPETVSQEECGILESAVEWRGTHGSAHSQSRVARTQSPQKQTVGKSSNIADSSLSANEAVSGQSPRILFSRLSSQQSPEKLNNRQSLMAEDKLAQKMITRQTLVKQTPQKRTVGQTPTKRTPTKQIPPKGTPTKQMATKETPEKRTIGQTPTKRTPTKQIPPKGTPTKGTPTKKMATKETPEKRTVGQTPTKRTPAKQIPPKGTPTKGTPTKKIPTKLTPQKRTTSQTPNKQTPQKKTISQTPTKLTPQERTISQTPSKLTPNKQTPQKQITRQTPAKQTPQKRGRRLTWKWGSDRKSALSKQSISTRKSSQKLTDEESLLHEASSKDEGSREVDTSGLHTCEAKKESKSGITDDDDDDDDEAECPSQTWIIHDELDTCNSGMIGQPRDDFVASSFEFVPASDNTTDGQQMAIQLPPINVQEKFCMEQGGECTASSPIFIALHDSPFRDSDKSEGWDSQVESFLNCVHETKALASPGISLPAAGTPNAPTAGQGGRSPLRQLDGLAAGDKDASVPQAAGFGISFSRRFGKRGADSNVVLCSPQNRTAVGEPLHCSTPAGSGRMVDENADGVVQEKERKQSMELHLNHSDVHMKSSHYKHSLSSKQKDGKRPSKSHHPSPLLGHNSGNKFDYLQLSKRFCTRAPLLVPKPTSDKNKHQSSGNVYSTKKDIKNSETSDCQVASGSSNDCSSLSLPGKSCLNEGQNFTSSLATESSSAERGKDCLQDDSHVVPKLTLDKKVALLAAKAKSNLDNSLYTTPNNVVKSKNSGRKPTTKRLLSVNYNSQNKRQCRRDVRVCSNSTGHTTD